MDTDSCGAGRLAAGWMNETKGCVSKSTQRAGGRAGGRYLSEVLFKVTQLQALLQLQMVFAPELFKGVFCLVQLGQKPETEIRRCITYIMRTAI